jgi:hypothetical protein
MFLNIDKKNKSIIKTKFNIKLFGNLYGEFSIKVKKLLTTSHPGLENRTKLNK